MRTTRRRKRRSPGYDFVTYIAAQEWAIRMRIRSKAEYSRFAPVRPTNVPANPRQFYKGCGWKGWGSFLGTGRVHKHINIPFDQARILARSEAIRLGLVTKEKYQEAHANRTLDHRLPSTPEVTYGSSGFTSWSDYLGVTKEVTVSYKFIQ